MPEQAVSMGKPENFPSYGWDNEYGEWNVKVPPFKASKYLVTNSEYLEFVNDGGYENSKYWTKEGWQWKQFRKFHHPSFWVCGKGCKSGCGADLASYSHCNLATDVNHNGLSEIDASNDDNMEGVAFNGSQNGDLNGVGNGFHQNGLSNGAMNGHQNGEFNGVMNEHQNGESNGVMNGHQNGESNGVMNGHQNGESNGIMNGHQNGESNGVMNGHQNGDSYGIANGHHNGVSDSAVTDANTCPYKYRAMFELLDMPMSWPVEVNYHEVKAYCAWKGPEYRLPTEAEHHVMRGPQKPPSVGIASDIIFQDKIAANINMAYGSSTPVNMFPPTEAGFCDVFGNVWEWLEDHFNGFSDFKPHLLYDDFSTPTFDGRHNMILGGSWVSTGDEASRFARFGFRRHFFQHLGFRVAQSLTASPPPVRLVDTPVFVLGVGVEDNPVTLPGVDTSTAYVSTTNKQYHDDAEEFLYSEVLSHYGDVLGVESTAEEWKELALVCREAVQEYNCPEKKILDVMCSLGRFSYELSNLNFQEVIAIDHSGRLLDAALKLQQGKPLDIKSAGDLPVFDIPLWKIFANLDGVSFQQFTWLPNEIGLYDLIVMRSLDRLASPKAWLVRLWEIINPVGLVIIKPSNNWDISSLRAVLENKFTLMETRVLPNRREGLRKSDMCHSSVTIWRLKH